MNTDFEGEKTDLPPAKKQKQKQGNQNKQRNNHQQSSTPISIFSMIGQLESVAKTSKEANDFAVRFDSIKAILALLNQISPEGSEVEARLGKLDKGQNKFTPGISKIHFDKIRDYYLTMSRIRPDLFVVTETKDISLIFESDNQRVRVQTTFAGEPIKCELKNKLTDYTIPTSPYDLRISLASEIPCELPSTYPHGYMMRRERVRWSISHASLFSGRWVLDLTDVSTYNNTSPAAEKSFEIEIEFSQNELKKFALADEVEKKSIANVFYDFLLSIQESFDFHSFDDVYSNSNLLKSNEFNEISESFLDAFHEKTVKHDRGFPGAMPVNLTRSAFFGIQDTDILVSEKTDGIRFMLFVNVKGVFLIGRRMEIYRINNAQVLQNKFSMGAGTILDCELVRNLNTRRPVILVFDLMLSNGIRFIDKPFGQRYKHSTQTLKERDALMAKYRTPGLDESQVPFVLLNKNFFRKSDIGVIFNCIAETGMIKIFYDSKRCHFTDGIILAPENKPYQTGTNYDLLKWKYTTHWTVDMGISFRDRSNKESEVWFTASVSSGNGSARSSSNEYWTEIRRVNMEDPYAREEIHKFMKDIATLDRPTEATCAEWGFDIERGVWQYRGLRPDKDKPNHSTVVIDTLEVIAQNITKEELTYRVVRKRSDDNWAARALAASSSSTFTSHTPHPNQQHQHQQHMHSQQQFQQQQRQQQRSPKTNPMLPPPPQAIPPPPLKAPQSDNDEWFYD